MAKVYTEEELNNFSRETLMAVILSMQDQIHQLNTNMERLIEQIADANNKRYGRSSEKLETISGQLELELIFNEAEALTETLYVVEPVEEDVIQPRRKNKGKREVDLKDLPIEVIVHTLSEEKLQDVIFWLPCMRRQKRIELYEKHVKRQNVRELKKRDVEKKIDKEKNKKFVL